MWRRFFTRLSGHGSRCSRPWQKSLKKTSFAYDYSLQALVDLTTGQFLACNSLAGG
jgi:3-methyladenine DNA glycosylase AlkC